MEKLLKNSEYLILRFDVFAQITKSKNKNKLEKLRWEYAGVFTKFKIDLIDKFCSEKWISLNEKYFGIDPITKKYTGIIPKYKKAGYLAHMILD